MIGSGSRRIVFVAVSVAALMVASIAYAANVPVLRDNSFGTKGLTITDIGGAGPEDEPFTLVMTPDAKFLTPGKAFNKATGNFDFAVMRYLSNGKLDSSFDGDGIALTDFGGHEEALDIVQQADGKIVAAGLSRGPSGDDFALVRYNSNGSLDATYGTGGRVTTDFAGGKDNSLGLALQSDGKVVAAGHAYGGATSSDAAVARYNTNGTLDTTFGTGGKVTHDFFGSVEYFTRVAVDAGGRVLAVGATDKGSQNFDFAFAAFLADGSPDPTFSVDSPAGYGTTDFVGGSDYGLALLPLPDGKILTGGLAFNPYTNSNDMALARYNADGTVDTSFATYGAAGLVTTDFFGMYDQILAITLQPDGKYLVAGHAQHPTRSFEFALARFTADGLLDPTFGFGGRYSMDVFGGPDGLHGMVLQSDGKAVVTGDTENPTTGGDDFILGRFLVADPSWTIAVVNGLPEGDVLSPTVRTQIVDILKSVQADVTANKISTAVSKLQALRTRMNGCGTAPDGDDWLRTCAAQYKVRVLVEQMIYKLS